MGCWGEKKMMFGQIITTSAEVTLNGGLVRELPQNPLNSGLGIILICPDDVSMGAFYFGMLPNVGQENSSICFFSLMRLFTSICLKIFCVYTLW